MALVPSLETRHFLTVFIASLLCGASGLTESLAQTCESSFVSTQRDHLSGQDNFSDHPDLFSDRDLHSDHQTPSSGSRTLFSDHRERFKEDEALAAKIKASKLKNPLWADTPMKELRPFIERMQLELGKAERRMIRAGTPWLIRKAIMIRVKYLALSVAAAKQLPTYRMTLDLVFRFQATISIVEEARGFDEFRGNDFLETQLAKLFNRTVFARTNFHQALWISQNTSAVVLPTFSVLSEADMNRFWSRKILIVGFKSYSKGREFPRGVLSFSFHDMDHIRQYFQAHSRVSFRDYQIQRRNGVSELRGFRESLRKFNSDLATSERIETPILSELDRYGLEETLPHPNLRVRRVVVERRFFDLRHESGVLPAIDPSYLGGGFVEYVLAERNSPSDAARERARERVDAILWLAEKYREQGVVVPNLSREEVLIRERDKWWLSVD